MKAHKDHTRDFEELTFAEQAKSINAEMAYLPKAVRAHLRKAQTEGRNRNVVRQKCVNQVQRLLQRLERI
jgi:hypothetical protein